MGMAAASRPYEAFPGQRFADFSTDSQNAFNLTRGNTGSYMPFYNTATNATGSAINNMQGELNSRMDPNSLGARDVGAGQWNSSVAQQYMNPFVENVLNRQIDRENQRFGQELTRINQSAAREGAFGGGRHGVVEAMARDDSLRRMADIDANGMMAAYDTAGQMFGRDRDAMLQGDMSNQKTDLGLNEMRSRLGMANVDAGLRGNQLLGGLGQQFADLGSRFSGLGYADAEALRGMGLDQEQLEQAGRDWDYGNFVDQRDYQWNNAMRIASLLHGAPIGGTTTVSGTQYVNPYAQMAGGLMSAYGLAQNMGMGR